MVDYGWILQLSQNRSLTLRNIRLPAKTLALSAEAMVDGMGENPTLGDMAAAADEANGVALPLTQAIKPDTAAGKEAELPVLEKNRKAGSTEDVNFWTSRDVREVVKSHINLVVADTAQWEQSAAFIIDNHFATEAFAKNAGMGFAIPYLFNGQPHDYEPDFIIRLSGCDKDFLIIETKGFDDRADAKKQAAEHWVSAVNASKSFGTWRCVMARSMAEVRAALDA